MIDYALAYALETSAPTGVRRQGWTTRCVEFTQDTSLPNDLATRFFAEASTSTPLRKPIEKASANGAASAGLADPFVALEQLHHLVDHWDGARAMRPAPLAISIAGLVVSRLQERALNPRITPDVDGGVVVAVHHSSIKGRFAALSCDNDGDTYLVLEAPPALPLVRKVDDVEGVGSRTLDEIFHFLSR